MFFGMVRLDAKDIKNSILVLNSRSCFYLRDTLIAAFKPFYVRKPMDMPVVKSRVNDRVDYTVPDYISTFAEYFHCLFLRWICGDLLKGDPISNFSVRGKFTAYYISCESLVGHLTGLEQSNLTAPDILEALLQFGSSKFGEEMPDVFLNEYLANYIKTSARNPDEIRREAFRWIYMGQKKEY